jgi:hypothetical protein
MTRAEDVRRHGPEVRPNPLIAGLQQFGFGTAGPEHV